MSIIGCSTDSVQPRQVTATLVPSHELPDFSDDLGLEGLSTAIQRQLIVLRKERDREALRIGQHSYRTERLLVSLERFNRLLSEAGTCLKLGESSAHCYETFNQRVRAQFLVYRVSPSLLTAYYTPTIEVSTEPTERFRYPIYRAPDAEWERRLTREDIDFSGKLDGKGYELYYAADRFDLYVMHVEGGARIVVNDGEQRYVKYLHYNADNGEEFTHIDDYMLNHGLITPGKQSRFDQRIALEEHPDKARKVYASCPGYVFFRVSSKPIITHTGISLTDNRSSATDPAYYPVKGIISYVVAPLPVPPPEGTPAESNPKGIEQRTMQRFFIDQDVGHHILGPARADLFFGESPYAEFLSNNFMTRGTIYLLISK
jgi:membrane-bound lytic murein transglycosylase A